MGCEYQLISVCWQFFLPQAAVMIRIVAFAVQDRGIISVCACDTAIEVGGVGVLVLSMNNPNEEA